ncbi:MAG: hypothetical protein ACYDGR_13960 [Candidatus Dormibacteria bacterium]
MAIDDPTLHLRAYSAHHGHVDQVRLTSILTRTVPSDVQAWALGQGIKLATQPHRVPGNPAPGSG